ncbi:unnamed protein product [Clonostachys rhizophaga]|uniref:Uncharacterized protein n=1 Tax=Clonostachys rhizophaga TaxID=160324 RepID=A0A9N9VJX5_9HYPO|nr:unnamed protein product [Clonostachys rhizophaga]
MNVIVAVLSNPAQFLGPNQVCAAAIQRWYPDRASLQLNPRGKLPTKNVKDITPITICYLNVAHEKMGNLIP